MLLFLSNVIMNMSLSMYIHTESPENVCVPVLVAVRQRIQAYADVRPMVTVTPVEPKPRVAVPERRPLFERRILEERHPQMQRDVEDDWFVLLDVDHKVSGILSCSGFPFTLMYRSGLLSLESILTPTQNFTAFFVMS